MKKFKVDMHRQISGYVIIEAQDMFEAFSKAENGDYSGEFIATDVICETVNNSNEVEEEAPE